MYTHKHIHTSLVPGVTCVMPFGFRGIPPSAVLGQPAKEWLSAWISQTFPSQVNHCNTLLARDILIHLLSPKCYWPECFNIYLHNKSPTTGISFCKNPPVTKELNRKCFWLVCCKVNFSFLLCMKLSLEKESGAFVANDSNSEYVYYGCKIPAVSCWLQGAWVWEKCQALQVFCLFY